ncbi:MAG: desulfoferrodoxin [Clostridiales bacterium]|nr:desulfoferrodoxin [Clostridiales bacterium]
MSEKTKFLIAEDKSIVGAVKVNGEIAGLKPLKANSTDAATEKHVPVVEIDGDTITVTVGSVEHPMEEKHYIEWVYVQTEKGGQRKNFKPGDKPVAKFKLIDDRAVAVFEYCNLHGLWVKEL